MWPDEIPFKFFGALFSMGFESTEITLFLEELWDRNDFWLCEMVPAPLFFLIPDCPIKGGPRGKAVVEELIPSIFWGALPPITEVLFFLWDD
jgi:hypothetical protein